MPPKLYAGIGARVTPVPIRKRMTIIAAQLHKRRFKLRSGDAKGADRAFQQGAGNRSQIFRAHDTTDMALAHAKEYHPAWWNCNDYVQLLHGRNSMIVLGESLTDPVSFVVCWTADGKASGGTGQALRIAEDNGIRIFNLFYEDAEMRLIKFVKETWGV